ncbi:hypothetical protein NECAME_11284 [Necator americanus]|uniref:Uncharacterized protein n=1 Tax=Necator americanus TaxID=51031 RepID=W2T7V9_NECAM|nr:hypothetical protein NECAME_11284 [Necator americanus]ETN77082.1 hypothetical protein NECAME_11284 [Necator americanus]
MTSELVVFDFRTTAQRPSQCLLDQSDTSFPKRKKDLVSTLRRGEINRSGGDFLIKKYTCTEESEDKPTVFYAECLDKFLKMRDSRQLSKLQIVLIGSGQACFQFIDDITIHE